MLPLGSSVTDGGGGGAEEEGGKERVAIRIMVRCCCTIVVSLSVSFLLSFVFGLLAIAMGSLSASNPVTVPAVCRIVSSCVDIKLSRVCELGFLNYKASNVFHPKEKTTFRCRDDYYWASIFEVEYKEYFSGQILHAVAEVPKEALPHDCRPNFDTAWMTKMKFEVNETYKCTYTLGSQKADIYPDTLFNCQTKDPSTAEMARRFFLLFGIRAMAKRGESSSRNVDRLGRTLHESQIVLEQRIDTPAVEFHQFALDMRQELQFLRNILNTPPTITPGNCSAIPTQGDNLDIIRELRQPLWL